MGRSPFRSLHVLFFLQPVQPASAPSTVPLGSRRRARNKEDHPYPYYITPDIVQTEMNNHFHMLVETSYLATAIDRR
jgi:hypothetical protein